MEEKITLTPHFPTYEQARLTLPVFKNLKIVEIKELINTILAQTGTPQNPVDWTEPEAWIPERLSGKNKELAMKIWGESNNIVNPRHLSGIYWLITRHELLADDSGIFSMTEKGQKFLNKDEAVIKEIDEIEGVSYVLSLVATKTRTQRKDLLPEWVNYLRKYTKYTTMSIIKSALSQRLKNLKERELIIREGNYYVITKKGSHYVEADVNSDPDKKVFQSISFFNEKQKEELRKILEEMEPYRFEHLVKDLLEAMGYEEVTVTSQTGDKGVDVVAKIQFGITNITEVVQVKRYKGNINRQMIDQLRGALPYHRAIRGTLITLSDFTKGSKDAAVFSGAAPITLINGKKLVELLFEHEIGIIKQDITLYRVDEEFFSEPTEEELPEVENDEGL